jgi:hypothetical protein
VDHKQSNRTLPHRGKHRELPRSQTEAEGSSQPLSQASTPHPRAGPLSNRTNGHDKHYDQQVRPLWTRFTFALESIVAQTAFGARLAFVTCQVEHISSDNCWPRSARPVRKSAPWKTQLRYLMHTPTQKRSAWTTPVAGNLPPIAGYDCWGSHRPATTECRNHSDNTELISLHHKECLTSVRGG